MLKTKVESAVVPNDCSKKNIKISNKLSLMQLKKNETVTNVVV